MMSVPVINNTCGRVDTQEGNMREGGGGEAVTEGGGEKGCMHVSERERERERESE
jgi:hypothetical protein